MASVSHFEDKHPVVPSRRRINSPNHWNWRRLLTAGAVVGALALAAVAYYEQGDDSNPNTPNYPAKTRYWGLNPDGSRRTPPAYGESPTSHPSAS